MEVGFSVLPPWSRGKGFWRDYNKIDTDIKEETDELMMDRLLRFCTGEPRNGGRDRDTARDGFDWERGEKKGAGGGGGGTVEPVREGGGGTGRLAERGQQTGELGRPGFYHGAAISGNEVQVYRYR